MPSEIKLGPSNSPEKDLNDATVAKPDLIYIMGPSYSGSTLLTFLLSKHPQIATIGELKATKMGDVSNYYCSCGDPILECDFWKDVTLRCRNKGVEFSVEAFDTSLRANSKIANRVAGAEVRGRFFEFIRRIALDVLPGARKSLDHSIRRNYEISQVVCDVQGKKVFLDGSKSPERLLCFLRSGLWNIKVICIQRDGRGVSNSTKKHMNSTMTDATKRWLAITREISYIRDYLDPTSYVGVTYEELCKVPEDTLRKITDACGLSAIKLVEGNLTGGDHHILGNSMRLKSMSEIRFDESWRSQLSESNICEFEKLAGAINANLGYK